MRARVLVLALLAAAPLAAPSAPAGSTDAPYTDHYGTWAFTGLAALEADTRATAQWSVLLRLADGSGFTAFVPVVPPGLPVPRNLVPTLYRPPMLAFECYSDLGTGNLVVRGQQTAIAGSCVQTLEDVGGQARFVVRFQGYQVPVKGVGVYCVVAAPASC